MPFLDQRQAQERAQLPAAEYHKETPWWDGYAASLGMVIDEEMTISSGMNRQGWQDRRTQVRGLGIDLQPYTDRRGRVDYDSISLEYEGVKTDAQLTSERNEMLASRRAYGQEVLANAPASAQFLGAMNGYLLDPLSIATMPIGYSVRGAQGLSLLSKIGQTAAKAAAVEGATELAIQSVVFDYKQEIDSPYAARDAITAIATAAAGASILAGGTTGIAGYLKSVRQGVDPATLTKGELKAYESVMRMEEALEGVESPSYRVTNEYAAMQRGEYKSFVGAAESSADRIVREADEIQSQSMTISRYIAENRGLNKAAFLAEGIDESALRDVPGGFGKPVFRATDGHTPDSLAEMLNQEGFLGRNLTANDAVDIVDDMLRGGNKIVDPDVRARVEDMRAQADKLLSSTDEEYLSRMYRDAVEMDIDAEAKRLLELETFTEDYNSRTIEVDAASQIGQTTTSLSVATDRFESWINRKAKEYLDIGKAINQDKALKYVSEDIRAGRIPDWMDEQDIIEMLPRGTLDRETGEMLTHLDEAWPRTGTLLDFIDGQELKRVDEANPPKAQTTSVESDVLARTGLDDAYNQTAAEYAALKNKVIFDGESNINADDLIKDFDDELNGLDNVMRCVRG